jgi:hypothetical protein
MKALFLLLIIIFSVVPFRAQILLNGDFTLGTAFWGCASETNPETTYGGSNGLNTVAEVDALAGLCQTVSGLTPGNTYELSFSASRRTGSCPAPLITNVNITIDGGVLITTVTRTNTTFGFTTSGFLFIATSASHTITFAGGSGFGGSTCGLIVDNIAVTTSALPIELMEFKGAVEDRSIRLTWATATEKNNDHFFIERSADGILFEEIAKIQSKATQGNSMSRLDYTTMDASPLNHLNYYRLKQVDLNGSASLSKLIAISFSSDTEPAIILYPNPNNGAFMLDFSSLETNGSVHILLVGSLGKVLHSQMHEVDKTNTLKIDWREKMPSGSYHCVVTTETFSKHFPVIIE